MKILDRSETAAKWQRSIQVWISDSYRQLGSDSVKARPRCGAFRRQVFLPQGCRREEPMVAGEAGGRSQA